MREEGSGTRFAVEKAERRANLKLEVGMELGSNGAIKHGVESGLGLAILSRYAVGLEETTGKLAILDVDGFPIRRQWHIVHLRRNRLASPVAGFIDFLRSGTWGMPGGSSEDDSPEE
jgi:DNA-binding transcriptional LysR family regulator